MQDMETTPSTTDIQNRCLGSYVVQTSLLLYVLFGEGDLVAFGDYPSRMQQSRNALCCLETLHHAICNVVVKIERCFHCL